MEKPTDFQWIFFLSLFIDNMIQVLFATFSMDEWHERHKTPIKKIETNKKRMGKNDFALPWNLIMSITSVTVEFSINLSFHWSKNPLLFLLIGCYRKQTKKKVSIRLGKTEKEKQIWKLTTVIFIRIWKIICISIEMCFDQYWVCFFGKPIFWFFLSGHTSYGFIIRFSYFSVLFVNFVLFHCPFSIKTVTNCFKMFQLFTQFSRTYSVNFVVKWKFLVKWP